MGHKFFRITLDNGAPVEHRFGELVNMGCGHFLTLHSMMSERKPCDYCGGHIDYGDAYVRSHAIRFPEWDNQPMTDRRCLKCIGKGILPNLRIRSLEVYSRFGEKVIWIGGYGGK